MTDPTDQKSVARALELARAGLSRPGAPSALPERLHVVDAERQVAIWQAQGGDGPRWLGAGGTHDDKGDGKQGHDTGEWSRRFKLRPTDE